jgi:hypothetical protein
VRNQQEVLEITGPSTFLTSFELVVKQKVSTVVTFKRFIKQSNDSNEACRHVHDVSRYRNLFT